ncbi:MAG: hypothetical protein QNK37_04045 [Acidobacteriota bacterium]|nr:hypothetical protein [Acidobacteriota bacterium]
MAGKQRCLMCGHRVELVWVHGHGQCPVCKTNVAPCCDGATACPPSS